MGIKSGHQVTYSIIGLSINQLYAIALRQSCLFHHGTNPPLAPTLDIDASWLVRSKLSILPKHKVGYLLKIALCFAEVGFDVVIVCDAECRHHTKRATIDRVADSFRNRIAFLKNCNKIQSIFTAARVEGRAKTEEEQNELAGLSSRTSILNDKISNTVYDTGDVFFEDIFNRINLIKLSANIKGSIKVIQAEQQADSCIAARAFRFISNIILTKDSDQAVMLCDKCISIKAYAFNYNKQTMGTLDIFTATKSKIEQIANYISLPLIPDPKSYVPAKYGLFDDLDDLYNVRALIAVGIGCDVHPSGVAGIGPKVLSDFIMKMKEDNVNNILYYNEIQDFYCKFYFKKNKISKNNITIEQELEFKQMIDTYVESFMYEPGNFFDTLEKIPQMESIYIYDNKPFSLQFYNKEFKRNDGEVDCCIVGGGVDCCVGPGTGEHLFLVPAAVGVDLCLSCSRSICSCCFFKNNKRSNEKYCVECFMSESNVQIVDLEDLPTEEVMAAVFEEYGCPTNLQDDMAERINMYQNIILNKKLLDKENYENIIKFPEQSTTYLNNLDVIIEFSLKDGGSFVNNENLPFEYLLDVLDIFKQLIEVDDSEDTSLNILSNQITPKLVQRFAEKSRMHFGWRLLIRGLRHSIDLLNTNVSKTNVKVFKYNDQTGIYLQMDVRSSMKKDWYKTEVAFTLDTIVACSCSCKCGSNGLEHIVCVHILPCLELLGFFLKEALAEHTLVELSYYVKKTDLSSIDKTLLTHFRKIIEVLLISCRANNIDDALKATSIKEMLSGFDVGTDQRKKFGPPPPREDVPMGPLKSVNFQSIKKIARQIRTGNVSTINKKQFHFQERNPMTYDFYIQTVQACNTFFSMFTTRSSKEFLNSNMVGYRLLEIRCNQECDFINIQVYKSFAKDIQKAIEQGLCKRRVYKKRNFNSTIQHNINDINFNNNDTYIECDTSDYEEDNMTFYSNDSNDHIINKENIPQQDNSPAINLQEIELITETNCESDNNTIKRRSCCVINCNTTTTNTPNAIWTTVPFSTCQPINSKSSDLYIKKFASGKFHREMYLKRLDLDKKDKRKDLRHCNNHELYLEQHEYNYKNKENNIVQLTKMFRLPIQNNTTYATTRNSLEIRKPISPRKVKTKTKYKIVSNENKRINNQKCNFLGCNLQHTGDVGFKWKRIPGLATIDPLSKHRDNKERLFHSINKVYRKIVRQRCGLTEHDTRQHLRICNLHEIIKEEIWVSWQPLHARNTIRSEPETILVSMYLPRKRSDIQLDANQIEREARQTQRQIRNSIGQATIQNQLNSISNSQSQSTLNSFGILLSAIDIMSQTIPSNENIIKYDNTPFHFKCNNDNESEEKEIKRTKFRLDNVNDKQIRHHTGFKSLCNLISFIIIINKGNIKKMIKTTTQLTWFEEYYLYFTVVWGRTCARWFDVGERFEIGDTTARLIFDTIQQEMLDIMHDYPKFTTFQEDIYLRRQEKWAEMFDDTRVVMWDMTDISIMQPSSAESARMCYNVYYHGCCGKGGIFLQSSSWIGTHDLWMGAVTDSEYLTRSGILTEQMEFVRNEDSAHSAIPFTNITDKGFRITAEAYRHGEQRVLQPPFMKSDRRFTTQQTVEAAAIATIRSANERAVNRIKQCHFIKRGLLENENVERVASVFLTFGFQTNFMFFPVQ